jgi:hypothetical protein
MKATAVRSILAQAFSLYRASGRAFLATAAVLTLPIGFVTAAIEWLGSAPPEGEQGLAFTLGRGALWMIEFSASFLTAGVLLVAADDAMKGRPVVWREVWPRGLARAWPIVSSGLGVMLSMVGWALVCSPILVGIALLLGRKSPEASGLASGAVMVVVLTLASARYALVEAAAVFEGKTWRAAVRRGVALTRGRRLLVLGCFIAVSLPWLLVAWPSLALSTGKGPLVSTLVTWVTGPLHALVAALLYRALAPEQDAPPAQP